ncbi:MAG: hypothetical protein IJ501_05535 [Bacilli bacterium]|nr:hypothetical protein [Bacilli bacterium]
MNYLICLGINLEELKEMVNLNPMLEYLNDKEINDNILFLKSLKCSDTIIKNIIICNPFYLNRSISDLQKLVSKLISIGLTNLNLLFDSNPYLLNKDAFEIDSFIKEKLKLGFNLESIIDLIDSDPYITQEI